MRSVLQVVVVGLLLLVGCTKPNPLDCSDGNCTDPAHPYCDADGSLGGKGNTCIAVSCTAGETVACHGDSALSCNASGNNYELTQCQHGCDPTLGCRACATSDQCANPSPICDSTSFSCRACKSDDECPTKVCDAGTCVAEAGILYASPNGSDTSSCSLAQPCTIEHAQILAIPATPPPLVRLLPGVYATGINIGSHTTLPIRFVATGATLAGTNPLQISNGANVEIRGVTALGSSEVVVCTATTTPRTKLSISDSIIRAGSNSAPLVDIGHATAGDGLCDVTLKTTEMDIAGSTGSGIFLSDNASVSVDRVRMHGTVQFPISAFGNRVTVGITNSVMDNVNFVWTTSDSSAPGSLITMGFNTIRIDSGNIDCSSASAYRTVKYEDNIIIATTQPSAESGSGCVFSRNVLYPFVGSPGTNIVAQPKFVDQANHDYHLQSTSPAIDAADPTTMPDFDGNVRPQGAYADIGAFEYKP